MKGFITILMLEQNKSPADVELTSIHSVLSKKATIAISYCQFCPRQHLFFFDDVLCRLYSHYKSCSILLQPLLPRPSTIFSTSHPSSNRAFLSEDGCIFFCSRKPLSNWTVFADLEIGHFGEIKGIITQNLKRENSITQDFGNNTVWNLLEDGHGHENGSSKIRIVVLSGRIGTPIMPTHHSSSTMSFH